ncbi:MAG: 50S ribosomal protein L11 [Chlamydiae bacterium]|nr:50S ribosomal protein L11 [Chlamydiota bacterium]
MAKKKVAKIIKLQISAGKANPAPPVGTALGPAGINIMGFCTEFNNATKERVGDVLPVVITVYKDKSFSFITKEPPVPNLIKAEIKLEKGSANPNQEKVGQLKRSQARKIAKRKMQDMGVLNEDGAVAMVCGTARSMGIDIEEDEG